MTCSKASMLMRWKIASRRMPALLTTPSSLPKLSVAVLTILVAGIASATVSKFATAVPPRFLISSTTSSAGIALDPEPSAAPPGSLTTTLAPSAAQSSAISRPMPRPAPVTMMDLPSSDFVAMAFPGSFTFALGVAPSALKSSFEARRSRLAPQDDECGCCATVTLRCELLRASKGDGRCECRHLWFVKIIVPDAAHLPHALLQRVHAVHAGMHVAQSAAIGVERQLAAGPRIAAGDELAGFIVRHEAEIAKAVQRQVRKRVVDHQMIDVLVRNAGFLEGQGARDLESARTVKRLHLADHRRLP